MEPVLKMSFLLRSAWVRRLSLSATQRVLLFFSSLMCRDVSLVTTQLGDVSLGLHDCTHEERREFIDGRGFAASAVADSFPGLREHRVVL